MQAWSCLAVVAPLSFGCVHRAAEPESGLPPGMTHPHPVTTIDWSYPPEATARREARTLSVRCVITEQGRAQECQALEPVPGVDSWAIGKLESASFVPATYGGAPVGSPTSSTFASTPSPRLMAGRAGVHSSRPERNLRGQQRPGCLAAALSLLASDEGPREPDRASRLLGASCAGGLSTACRRLDESFQGPRLLTELPLTPLAEFTGAKGEVVCWVSANGQAHDCRGPDSPPGRWFIEQLTRARFAPATFEREPFETEYPIRFSFSGRR
jgi:hypothetical protein